MWLFITIRLVFVGLILNFCNRVEQLRGWWEQAELLLGDRNGSSGAVFKMNPALCLACSDPQSALLIAGNSASVHVV